MKQQIYKALLMRYQAQMEESLVRIDALMKAEVVPGHSDLVGEIDKHLGRRTTYYEHETGTDQVRGGATTAILANISSGDFDISQEYIP